MKYSIFALLVFAALVAAEYDHEYEPYTAYGYLKNIGIPEAERLRQLEEEYVETQTRIVGGVPAAVGQYPWQAGLLIDLIGISNTAVCGGSVISANKVLTAAHCWFDGRHQAHRFTVVLGSVLLFTGGTRIQSSVVAMHPNWTPSLIRNDVAVIYLPNFISISSAIAPVSLPSGSELNENFAGQLAIASGFGITSDGSGISQGQFLSHVRLSVMQNSACSFAFPLILQPSNLCTSGVGGVGTCRGDSGGPLVISRNNRNILIGVTSFGSALGCQINLPAAFARVTYYMPFINQHL